MSNTVEPMELASDPLGAAGTAASSALSAPGERLPRPGEAGWRARGFELLHVLDQGGT